MAGFLGFHEASAAVQKNMLTKRGFICAARPQLRRRRRRGRTRRSSTLLHRRLLLQLLASLPRISLTADSVSALICVLCYAAEHACLIICWSFVGFVAGGMVFVQAFSKHQWSFQENFATLQGQCGAVQAALARYEPRRCLLNLFFHSVL